MSDISVMLFLVPGLPLVSAIVTALLGPKLLRERSHLPTILATVGSCVVSFLLLAGLLTASDVDHPTLLAEGYTWFSTTTLFGVETAPFDVKLNLQLDTLSAVMLIAITFVGTWIAVFSSGYMKGEGGYPRYFAVMSLFLFSMTGLVLADNFLALYAFWEGVGLCSYLLVGFWFSKRSAAAAARKAFLVTRLGDAGLILGIMMIWSKFGHRFDFATVFEQIRHHQDSPYLTAACLLIFCGAVGKSAQFPLHVWLPDAMEGPTPASALIHAATMVTAGVYLVARCTPMFVLAPVAQLTVGVIGAFTALLAALIALTQTDLKRVLAYSTVSQLGYMFLGLGAGLREHNLAVFAVSAAIFHLFTHAFFKALLFLGAGSVMHAMGHVIDMRRFSGLRRVMPHTHWTFGVGSLALAGLIPFSGFWSKDQILESALMAREHAQPYANVYLALFVVGLVTAALTAFYTFRAYFKTFWGELKVPDEAYHHHGDHGHDHGKAEHTPGYSHEERHGDSVHTEPIPPHAPGQGHRFESPAIMTVPLIVLAIGAAIVGLALEGATHWISGFLSRSAAFQYLGKPPEHHLNWLLIGLSTLAAGGGIAVAAVMYCVRPELPVKLAQSLRPLYQLSLHRFLIDELYALVVVRPMALLAAISRFFDSLVDGIVDVVGAVPGLLGRLIRPVQNGLVQFYALFMMVFLTALMMIFVLWVR